MLYYCSQSLLSGFQNTNNMSNAFRRTLRRVLSSSNLQSEQAVICWCACAFSIFYCPFSQRGKKRKASECSLLSNEEKKIGEKDCNMSRELLFIWFVEGKVHMITSNVAKLCLSALIYENLLVDIQRENCFEFLH